MLLAQGGRIAAQAVYFIVIARALGISGFGALAGTVALVSIFVPFAAWGSGNILVMTVARDEGATRRSFGNALLAIAASSALLVPLVIGIGAAVLRVPLLAVALFALADLSVARVADIAAAAFQGLDRLSHTAWLSILAPVIRCVGALVFAGLVSTHSLTVWAAVYFIGSVAAAVVSYSFVVVKLGTPQADPASLRTSFKLGGYFAVSLSAATIYSDIDKTMLARLSTLSATGIYAAADRAVGMAFLPVGALLGAAYARFFRAGERGIVGSTEYALRLTPAAAGYGALVGLALFVAAPLAPHILGSDFDGSVEALRWLAPVPLLSALYYLPADALTGADAQGIRTLLQLAAAVLNVLLNVLLIPAHSWHGAAWATLASLSFLAASLWVATYALCRSQPRRTVLSREMS